MSSADDILFEPLNAKPKTSSTAYQPFLDAVIHALDGLQSYSFSVDNSLPIEFYSQIADLVEKDQNQIDHVKQAVTYDPTNVFRPANALNIRDVFRRMQEGEYRFWYAGKLTNGAVVREFEFDNYFAIDGRLTIVKLRNQPPANTYFEWWVASLLSNFAGYSQNYAFGSLDEAHKYHLQRP